MGQFCKNVSVPGCLSELSGFMCLGVTYFNLGQKIFQNVVQKVRILQFFAVRHKLIKDERI